MFQYCARFRSILFQLRLEVFQTLKSFLVAQTSHELECQCFVIQIALEVE